MWWFPVITGVFVVAAGAISLLIYRRTGSPLSMLLGLGLMIGVGINSFVEGYEAYMESLGVWRPGDFMWLATDTLRAMFIMIWALFEAMLILEITQWRGMRARLGVSITLFAVGMAVSAALNLFTDPKTLVAGLHPYTLSSYFRVFVFLIPLPLILAYLLIARLYRLSGSRGAMLTGLAFLLHGATLPTYPFLKVAESTLALWYALGGIVPAFAATLGIYQMEREAAS